MKTVEMKVIIQFDDAGRVDVEHIKESVQYAIDRARDDGAITPNDDAHALLLCAEVTEVGFVS
jgi:hypothetical protein